MRINNLSKVPWFGFLLAVFVAARVPAQDAAKVEYGRYLAEEVGKCHLCHTPKDEKGELDKNKWMKGRVLDIQPLETIQGWHKTAPDITPGGRLWKRWGGEGAMVKYLTTGLTPSGKYADPPMPAYKLKQADAEAMAAYLMTLK